MPATSPPYGLRPAYNRNSRPAHARWDYVPGGSYRAGGSN